MTMLRSREEREARIAPTTVHTFDPTAIIQRLRSEPEYQSNGRNGMTLAKTSDLRVLLEVLSEGAALAEHTAPGPITLQVLEGELRFQAGEEVIYVRAGELISLPIRERHSVEALRESAFLLTIAPEEGRKAGCGGGCKH